MKILSFFIFLLMLFSCGGKEESPGIVVEDCLKESFSEKSMESLEGVAEESFRLSSLCLATESQIIEFFQDKEVKK